MIDEKVIMDKILMLKETNPLFAPIETFEAYEKDNDPDPFAIFSKEEVAYLDQHKEMLSILNY